MIHNNTIVLNGIAWNHSRAVPPLIATAQRYGELNPHVSVKWEKRSLHEFGHADLAQLMARFDMVIMDHPWAGFASKRDILVPLHDKYPSEFLQDLSSNSTGPSYESYLHEGVLQALPVDGATPAACRRPDLLPDAPETWDDVLALAREGRVVMPGFHVDVLLNFMGLCATLADGRTWTGLERVAEDDVALEALDLLKELAPLLPEDAWNMNPIAVYESLAVGDRLAYCPFAYSYSNYSRRGFCANPLEFSDTVALRGKHGRIRTIIGGTGIALSRRCGHAEAALDYMSFVASGTIQGTLYAECGGQPAHLSAWQDDVVNGLSMNFFKNTLPTMDRSVVRPRHDGSIAFQEKAGIPIVRFLREGGKAADALDEVNRLYRDTRVS